MSLSAPDYLAFLTSDGLTLPGLLYHAHKKRACAIYLHGNGSSSIFYHPEENRIMAAVLARKNIAIFYFNNRGAHLIKKLTVRRGEKSARRHFGMAYEKIKDCLADIDGAIALLKQKGYREFYLIGSSTGANKICVYNFYRPRNEIKKYILLAGGDDVGIYYHFLGKNKFWSLLKKSHERIRNHRGDEIIKDLLPGNIFSYTGFYDIAHPDGDYNIFPYYEILRQIKLSKRPLFRHFRSIKKPTLVVYGEKDEYAWGNVPRVIEILKIYQPDFTYQIIPDADHGFHGHERELGQIISDWL